MYTEELPQEPKSEKEFWDYIREMMVHCEALFISPLETREEALALGKNGEWRREGTGGYCRINYRPVSEDNDQREYFYERGL